MADVVKKMPARLVGISAEQVDGDDRVKEAWQSAVLDPDGEKFALKAVRVGGMSCLPFTRAVDRRQVGDRQDGDGTPRAHDTLFHADLEARAPGEGPRLDEDT